MLGFLKVTCEFCNTRVPKSAARRGQDDRRALVCNACYEQWENAGRKCAACETSVRGMQDVGIFVDRKGFGHADCSGVRLLRA